MICFSIIASYSAILCLLVPYHYLLSVLQEVDALASSRGGRRKNKTGTNKKYHYVDTNNNKSTTHHHHHAILHDLVAEQQRQQQQQQFQHNDDEAISFLSSSISSHSSSASSSSAIWIDMENVRGKSGFLLNHHDVLEKTELWMKHFQLQDQIIIVVDHGGERDISKPSAYYLEQQQYAVVFSGNACKADDIIARGIGDDTCFPFYSSSFSSEEEERNKNTVAATTTKTIRERGSTLGLRQRLTTGGRGKTIVVTADNELIARCRRAAKNEFHVLHPQVFLEDFEWVSARQQQIEQQQLHSQEQQRRQQQSMDDKQNTEENESSTPALLSSQSLQVLSSSSSSSSSEEEEEEKEATTPLPTPSSMMTSDEQKILNELDIEIRLRGQLLDTEIQLNDRKKKRTNNKRKKLTLRIQGLRTKLASLRKGRPSLLDQLISNNNEDVDGIRIPRAQQDVLLARWKEIQQSPSSVRLHHRKEQTEDRIIYAESLRRELDNNPTAIKYTKLEMDDDDDIIAGKFLPSAKLFVNHINGYNNNDSDNDRDNGGSNDMTTKRLFYSNTFPVPTSVPVPVPVPTITTMERDENVKVVDDDTMISSVLSTEQLLLLEKNIRKNDDDNIRSNDDDDEGQSEQQTTSSTLDIVVISDTHGFENQLGSTLPDGDVLLHLGDFAYEGSHQSELRSLHQFDLYLSKQTHIKYKIVIRGNHDPMYYDFPISKAMYLTSPTNLQINGFQMTCIPYGNARKLSESGVLKNQSINNDIRCCDILASHCPPYQILDKTYTGKHVGSSYLTNAIRTSYKNNKLVPPKVWFVGHIHEGRGIAKRNIVGGSNKQQQETTTTVINAANANLGYATHLEHGPVVVRIDQNHRDADILQMEDNHKNGHPKSSVSNTSGNPVSSSSFFDDDHEQQQQQQPPTTTTTATTNNSNRNSNSNSNRLLLSVDLGLKSGMSLFSNNGNLVRYEQFHFQDRNQLQNDIVTIMRDWEKEVNVKGSNVEEEEVVKEEDDDVVRPNSNIMQSQEQEHRDTEDDNDDDDDDLDLEVKVSVPWKITHIAIEGGDTELLDIWSNAAPNHSSLLRVSPEEWRAELLTRKETTSGRTAKEASRLIARQIVAQYGSDQASAPHVGKFPTDVAESVCLGMYVSRRLGWIASNENEPAIQRYTNGNIIVPTIPKKIKK